MKQLLLFLLVFPIIGYSQCPPDGEFNSQAEIDAFATDYPDCTMLSTSLIISGDDITDLSGLGQITACTGLGIGGNLVLQNTDGLNPNLVLSFVEGTGNGFGISNNAALIEITGLENLVNQADYESDFRISDNPMLTSIAGVPNSFNAQDFMYITNNDALTSLIGIENYGGGTLLSISDNDALTDLTGIGGNGAEIVIIRNNDALQSLDGSELIGFDDYLYIEDNQNLTDISAIYAGSYVDDRLIIRNNPNLAACSVTRVCFYIYDNGIEEGSWLPGIFENNAPGCNSNYEVEYGCGLLTNDDCDTNNYPSTYNNYLTLGETIQATNEYATTSSQTPSCNEVAGRQDVWFVFESGASTTIDVIVETGFNLQLWKSSEDLYPVCGGQIQVESACNSESLIDIPVTPNSFYFVQVWSDDTGRRASGWFSLLVQDGALSVPEVALSNIKIFPNPTNDILNIQSSLKVDKVSIFNMLGQNVYESTYYTNDVSVNISNLNRGMYMAIVSSDGRESTYKIIKQ